MPNHNITSQYIASAISSNIMLFGDQNDLIASHFFDE